MTQEQIIADYKKARNITDEYVLDEDEMYFVEQIYFLHQEKVKNCSIPNVVESSSKQECYKIEGKFCDCSGLCRESY